MKLLHLAGPGGEAQEDFLAELVGALSQAGLRTALARPEPTPAGPPALGQAELRLAAGGLTLTRPGEAPSLEEGLRLLADMDLVISLLPLEEGGAVVEFCPAGAAPTLLGRAGLVALAGPGPFPLASGAPGFTDPAALAQFLASRAAAWGQRRSLTILADGQPLKAKAFVNDIIANSLHGLLAPLKGAQGARRLEILIEE